MLCSDGNLIRWVGNLSWKFHWRRYKHAVENSMGVVQKKGVP